MSKYYRNNSMNPATLTTLAYTDSVGLGVLRLTQADFKNLTKEEYFAWITDWKVAYKYVSDLIRASAREEFDILGNKVTQETRSVVLHHLRVLANTLLNARHYAKDVRRGVTSRET